MSRWIDERRFTISAFLLVAIGASLPGATSGYVIGHLSWEYVGGMLAGAGCALVSLREWRVAR